MQAADPYLRVADAPRRRLGFSPKFGIEPRSVPLLLGDDPRRLKNPALEDERVVVRRVIRSAQLHASDPPLDVRVVDALHFCVDDSIAQILLAVLRSEERRVGKEWRSWC